MKIILKGRIPSKKNSKMMVNRGGRSFLIPSPEYKAWHEEQMWMIKKHAGLYNGDIDSITLEFYFPDNRKADMTNKAESVMDLLVDSGVIKDDAWQIVDHLHLISRGIDKMNPRVEINISIRVNDRAHIGDLQMHSEASK